MTPASRKPTMDGIEETPMTRMVTGIQNHTVPTAAPVIIDAVGTTPRCRRIRARRFGPTEKSSVVATGKSDVSATMPLNLGTYDACRYGVSPRPVRGLTPGRVAQ